VRGATLATPVPSGAVEIKVVEDPFTTGTYLPKDATAKVGQTVAWEFADPNNAHSVTADDGSFDSGTQSDGFVFTHVFAKPGTYTYHCSLHTGTLGKVTVTP
jgi:plastocyanin